MTASNRGRTAKRGRTTKRGRAQRSRARRIVTVTGSVALVLGIVTVAVLALYVGNRALIAKDALQKAQSQLVSFKAALGQPGAPSTAAMYRGLTANTTRAAAQTDDPVWKLFEKVPVLGPNLIAFRQVADLTHVLVRDGVGPLATAADGLSVDSLKPKNGRIDIAPLKKLTPAITDVDDALRAADTSASAIDTTDVVPQLKQPIGTLRSLLQQAMPVTHELRKVMPVLYPALGGDGTRHYILLFQNNAEERASGGNPAAMAMLKVDDGKISLGRQPNSGDFPRPYATPPVTIGGDWDKVYGAYTSSYVTNITMTPDYPTTARLARAMWRDQFGGKVDGVISFDPVALSYLMRATGPIALPTGEKLNADNAVQYLLSGVYATYTDPAKQNAVFASAAKAIFSAVTSGSGSPKAYLAALTPMLNDQRLKAWSVRKNEEDLLLTSQAGNMMPVDNSKATVLGVYNNDDATSKMSYYMDSTVDVQAKTCAATPKYTVSTTVTDTLKPDQVSGLTAYVLAGQDRIVPGGDRQWVQLYGPVGSKLVNAYIDGVKVVWGTNYKGEFNTNYDATGILDNRPAAKAEMYDRPVGVVSIKMGPGEHVTVKGVFTGGTKPSPTIQVSHTPKVHDVPVTIEQVPCT